MLSCDLLSTAHGAASPSRTELTIVLIAYVLVGVLQLRPTQQAKEATGDFKSKFLKSALGCYILNIIDCGNYGVQGKQVQGIFPHPEYLRSQAW